MYPNAPMQGGQQQMPQSSNPFSSLMSSGAQMPQQQMPQGNPFGGMQPGTPQQNTMQGYPPMPVMGQNPLQMQGQPPGSLPGPQEQDAAMQRLLAQIRAGQGGQQQSQADNLRSMLGL